MATDLPYPNGVPLRVQRLEDRFDVLTRDVDDLHEQVQKKAEDEKTIAVLVHRVAELESTVKWLVRTTVGLAGVIAAAAGIIANAN